MARALRRPQLVIANGETRVCALAYAKPAAGVCSAYGASVDIRVDVVGPSLTAVVVVEPMDLARFMACYDAVYAFLRSDTDVRQTGQNVALYQHGQRMEVGVEVDRTFPSAGLVVSSQLPGGRIAHATHTTGYGDLHRTYDAVRRWCDEHGHDTAGIQWEVYSDPDERDHVDVEICYLLS